ncbi:MAG: stress responsive protein [Planctomycetes bacterium RBG_16_64_10]|nr:MAG: stress responsive protein [Planctomycetes bacterium RBG_16_64_10]
MRRFLCHYLATILAAPLALVALGHTATADQPQLAHMVYFSLKDNSNEAKQKLVAACKKYLSGHEGTVYFSAGARATDMNRPVNVQDFDVSLNLVFKDKAAHDRYAEHPRHLEFIREYQAGWAKVRVFDSYLDQAP